MPTPDSHLIALMAATIYAGLYAKHPAREGFDRATFMRWAVDHARDLAKMVGDREGK